MKTKRRKGRKERKERKERGRRKEKKKKKNKTIFGICFGPRALRTHCELWWQSVAFLLHPMKRSIVLLHRYPDFILSLDFRQFRRRPFAHTRRQLMTCSDGLITMDGSCMTRSNVGCRRAVGNVPTAVEKSILKQHGALAQYGSSTEGTLDSAVFSCRGCFGRVQQRLYRRKVPWCGAKAEEDGPRVWSACCLSIADRDELTPMFWTATCAIDDTSRLRAVRCIDSQMRQRGCCGHRPWLTVAQQTASCNCSEFLFKTAETV